MTPFRKNAAAGFTLLEALVVLVITGLVSVVLIQGYGLILSSRTSVENKLVDLDRRVLEHNVFLEPLRGLLPDYPDRPNMFAGDAHTLHGLTARALQEPMGVPVGFAMSMDYDASRNMTSLKYKEVGTEPRTLGQWEGNRGTFAYRDRSGEWSDIWPPKGAEEKVTQTPWAIKVDVGGDFPTSLVAAISGSHQRIIRMQDVMGLQGAP